MVIADWILQAHPIFVGADKFREPVSALFAEFVRSYKGPTVVAAQRSIVYHQKAVWKTGSRPA